ncbi:hypothetical protein ABFS83_05G115600 [Erythranthe nasuta]
MSAVDVALSPIHKETNRDSSSVHLNRRLESIVIYITVGGSSIPMRVMESDSIASVKLRIQSCKGFVVKKQKLVFGGKELSRTDSLVKDYGITNGNVLHLALRISDVLLINVSTVCGKRFELQVDRHRNVGYLKRRIIKKGKGKGFIDLEEPLIFCHGEKLEEDQRLINDISKDNDAVIHLVVQKSAKVWTKPVEKDVELSIVAPHSDRCTDISVLSRAPLVEDFFLKPIIVNPNVNLPPFLWDMIDSVFEGLANGKQPIRSSEGTGGTYFMQDSTGEKYVSVFKPVDEEPLAVNNPQGLPLSTSGEGLKRGTRVGEGALREVAAYLLDHPKTGPRSKSDSRIGFAGVPPTIMVRCLHGGFHHPEGFDRSNENIKTGSMQMYMKNNGSCEDVGPGVFPVEEVHKISVFDIRTANADRHAGNILLRKKDGEKNGNNIVLIPIDHGYCLPENFEDCTFEWLYWPQTREPFSQETKDYIKSLDPEQDLAILDFHGLNISHECALTLRISTMLLKKGAERGFTPFVIGSIMCRETLNKKSVIEEIVDEAKEYSAIKGMMSEAAFLETVSEIMDETLDKLMK